MHFTQLGLIEPLARAVRSEGYVQPTPIQLQAIPHVLAGKDLLGCAQTGTGKTAAFALPILQRLSAAAPVAAAHPHGPHGTHAPHVQHRPHGQHGQHGHSRGPTRAIRALIIGPTRELASQIGESFRVYGQHTGLRHTVIFGGVGQGPQVKALSDGVDILVATPGRLLDLLGQRMLTLGKVEVLVLDEADRMLDMGFIHDIRKVIAQIPARRQTLLFSATMPSEIRSLAASVLHHPVEVRVAAVSAAADTVDQSLYFAEKGVKPALLEQLLRDPNVTRALVFTRTKHGADKVVRWLSRAGLHAEAIHSNKSQNARTRALDNFKRGKILALIASDIAARGLDVDDISHVINFDLPSEPETYVHRIGRTGRAGARGQAITFCTEEQRGDLRAIERLIGKAIPVLRHSTVAPPPDLAAPSHRQHVQQALSRGQHGQQDHRRSHGQSHAAKPPHGGRPASHHARPAQGGQHTGDRTGRPTHQGHGRHGGSSRPGGSLGRRRRRRGRGGRQ